MEVAITVVTSVLTSGLVTLAIQTWITERIKHQYELERERLRADLQCEAVRFTKMHDRRAELIEKLFQALTELRRKVKDYIAELSDGEPLDEKRKRVDSALKDLDLRFMEARLFLPEATESAVEQAFRSLRACAVEFYTGVESCDERRPPKMSKEAWDTALSAFDTKVEPVLPVLKAKFRMLLGIEKE